jgi:hypothetical protein
VGCASFGGCGIVFTISSSGAENVIYRFKGGKDGTAPYSTLIAVNGILYGTTVEGGTGSCSNFTGCGTVFELGTLGKERVLLSFEGSSDGEAPYAGLFLFKGKLYGTTSGGGSEAGPCGYPNYGCGTIYRISP